MRWPAAGLLAIVLTALLLVACGGGGVDKGEVREAAEGFFRAISDDPPKAYTYLSDDCRQEVGLVEFAASLYLLRGFLGESDIEVKDLEIVDEDDERITARFNVVVKTDDEDIPLVERGEGQEPMPFVREDGRWRFAQCRDFLIDEPSEESGSEEATAAPDPRAPAVAVEADDDPSLPGEYVDLPRIYGGFYGNDNGPSTADHIQQQLDYTGQGLPPAGGPHWGAGACGNDPVEAPPFCGPVPAGIYREPWEAESLVHNMEHAGVVIWYNTTDEQVIDDLEQFALDNNNKLLVLTPYADMEPDTVAITAWSRRDKFAVAEYSRERVQRFFDAHYCRFDPEGLC